MFISKNVRRLFLSDGSPPHSMLKNEWHYSPSLCRERNAQTNVFFIVLYILVVNNETYPSLELISQTSAKHPLLTNASLDKATELLTAELSA